MSKFQNSLNRMSNIVLCDFSEKDQEHIKTVIEALEKQIPKKVCSGKVDYCPTCDNLIAEEWLCPNYCKDCGQALDWGDEE